MNVTGLIASDPVLRLGVLLGVFALVCSIAALASRRLARRGVVRRELVAIARGASTPSHAQSIKARRNDAITRIIERIERSGLNLATRSPMPCARGWSRPAIPRPRLRASTRWCG